MKTTSALAFALFALTAFGAAPQAQSDPLSDADRIFVTEALRQGLVEEELGRLAQVKSAQPSFVNVGKMLERDRARMHQDLITISKRHGLKLPTTPSEEDRKALAGLMGLRYGAFDELFKTTLIANTEQQLALFRKAATDASAADVRQLAERAIPVLEAQLKMAQGLVPNRSVLYG